MATHQKPEAIPTLIGKCRLSLKKGNKSNSHINHSISKKARWRHEFCQCSVSLKWYGWAWLVQHWFCQILPGSQWEIEWEKWSFEACKTNVFPSLLLSLPGLWRLLVCLRQYNIHVSYVAFSFLLLLSLAPAWLLYPCVALWTPPGI